MVFENIVANVLNRFLGDFVDNLDPSQLNIGIWGGNVKLNDLEMKQSALDMLDLPIKLKYGRLKNLVMKIPWKNLYTEPVVIYIEGLHCIIVPNQGILYDEEKVKKNERELKKNTLNSLEENRQSKRKANKLTSDSFVEKVVGQIIKNLQINIKSIHIRYEDKFSNRNRAFAAGVTLESLEFQTTDCNFNAQIQKDDVKICYKLIAMKNLAIYWNSNTLLMSDFDSKDQIFSALVSSIATEHVLPKDFKYIFGLISTKAKLELNRKPEVDYFKIPKINLHFEMNSLPLFIDRNQYQDILYYLDAQERFYIGMRFLKFRPNLTTYQGHYKEWYRFAYNCIIDDIRRKKKNWSWKNMRSHIDLVRSYREAWLNFRTERDVNHSIKEAIKDAEEKLDVFNINVAREQVELEIDRLNLIRTEDMEPETWGSWVGSWFGGKNKSKTDSKGIISQFQQAMTTEEKTKLFTAIDYQENMPPTNYPMEFIENKITIKLNCVVIAVDDAVKLRFENLMASIEQRNSARAVHVKSNIQSLLLEGLGYSMLDMLEPQSNWLNLEYIKNPLNSDFDQIINFSTAPIFFKYHAPAINAFLQVFKPPESIRLHQLAAKAFARYEEFKVRSLTGLKYAVDQKEKLNINIHLSPMGIVLTEGGSFNEKNPNLLAQLGSLKITTVEDSNNFKYGGDIENQKNKEILMNAYMKLQILFSDIQLSFADTFEKLMEARNDAKSPYHIIKPMSMELCCCNAMVDDFQVPKFRICGDLPHVTFAISDLQLTNLLRLLMTFPIPSLSDSDEEQEIEQATNAMSATEIRNRAKMVAIMDVTGFEAESKIDKKELNNVDVQLFVYDFSIGKISASLYLQKQKNKINTKKKSELFASLTLKQLNVQGNLNESGYMQCKLSLESITMDDKREGSAIERLLDKKSNDQSSSNNNLFFYLFYEKNSDCNQKVDLISSSFYLILSPEFLGALFRFVEMPKIEQMNESMHTELKRQVGAANTSFISSSGGGAVATKKNLNEAPVGLLTMKCRIQYVEVILVENSYKANDSQALILSLNVVMDAANENGIQNFNGSIQNLQLTSTYFALEKRKMSTYSVLKKLNIYLTGTIDDKTKTQDFNFSMEKVHVKVSPSIIRLLSAVATQFSLQKNEEDNLEEKNDAVLKSYPNYYVPKKIKISQYWWFQAGFEEGQDACNINDYNVVPKYIEKASFSIDSFVITIEAGVGEKTLPMILVDSSLNASALNWSSKMEMDAAIMLQMSYYNEKFCVWEPVIEPVQVKENNQTCWKCWQLTTSIRTNDDIPISTTEIDGSEKTVVPPKMNIFVEAKEMMNVTITKSFLQLIYNLNTAFQEAAKQISPPITKEMPASGDYLIKNETGLDIKICSNDTLKVSNSEKKAFLPHFDFYELNVNDEAASQTKFHSKSLFFLEDRRKTAILLEFLNNEREINVMRAEKRCIQLPKKTDLGQQWMMVVDTRIENFRHVVFLRSIINFVNHLKEDVEIYSETGEGTRVSLCGVAKSNDEALYIPLKFLYTPTGKFYIGLNKNENCRSEESICWHDFDKQNRFSLHCEHQDNIYIEAVVQSEDIMDNRGKFSTHKLYTIHLYPPLYFHNLLPIPLTIHEPIQKKLMEGEGTELNLVAGLTLKFSFMYDDVEYSSTMIIPKDPKTLDFVTLSNESDSNKKFNIGLNWSTQNQQLELNVYARHWLVNNTGKNLQYLKSSKSFKFFQENCLCSCFANDQEKNFKNNSNIVSHPASQNLLLMSLDSKNFFNNKKAQVSIHGLTNFSNEFPLDTPGSGGSVICRSTDGQEYALTISVTLCHFGLTKIVTISPFYLVQNQTKFDIEVSEYQSETWLKIASETCIALWPTQSQKRKKLRMRYYGQKECSVYFPFTETFDAFCKIPNKYLGVYVTCFLNDSSSVVRIEPFLPGMASAILMNATNFTIKFGQHSKNSSNDNKNKETILEPWHLQAFTWEDVVETDRTLRWKCGEYEGQDQLMRNGTGSFLPFPSKKNYYYWVSFLNGRQRILLFTYDVLVANTAFQSYESERIDRHTEISIYGIGVSLVNNLESVEILYMAMSSSGILWEQLSRSRYRPFPIKAMEECETAYLKWKEIGQPAGFQTTENFEIDFQNWQLNVRKKEHKSKNTVKIRRCFQNGLWIQYRQSLHQQQFHMKLNHLRIDNQLPACVFPCVLAVLPPPKSIVINNEPKPFTELSCIMSKSEYSNIVEVKYLHILVQEFSISLDNGLINSVISLFDIQTVVPKSNFKKDLDLTKPQLNRCVLHTTATTQIKSYYDDLHISPLMIHFSFSQGGGLNKQVQKKNSNGGINIHSEFLNLLLKSVGVTLTELQDIVFKLAYFERKYVFYSSEELKAEIQSHYTFQFVKQLYVFVFGLDIIGNPYGLVRDLSSGVEDFFYQPFQGAIQGPEEFAEGLALGVQSLFGHAVGGAAGAASRIAGTLGKGVAALTLDENYQRKRQEALNRRPQNIGENLTRGARGVTQGFFEGVTGVFTKPLEGARNEGIGGFAKGLGKGFVGIVARPVSGVVDFASGTLDALKHIATNTDNAKSIRPPRLILNDQIIRPFSYENAIGYKIFRDTDHGKFVDTDHFICHALISQKFVFVVTDLRVFLSKLQDLLGNWTAEWILPYSEIKEPRISAENKCSILLELKQPKSHFLGLGLATSKGKSVVFNNSNVAEYVYERLLTAYKEQ